MSIIDELSEKSWTVQKNWLAPERVLELRQWAEKARHAGEFKSAGIGRDQVTEPQIRGDQILWVENDPAAAVRAIWQSFEDLRLNLNRELFLGLDHFEMHFAVYPAGQFYQAHVDQPQNAPVVAGRRVLSFVLYLNPDWNSEDEGSLIFLDSINPAKKIAEVLPVGGTLALFQSDTCLHEVLPPRRERWSLTGWFRRR